MSDSIPDKLEINVLINVARQVSIRNQSLKTDHLKFVLLRGRLFEHGTASEKSVPQLLSPTSQLPVFRCFRWHRQIACEQSGYPDLLLRPSSPYFGIDNKHHISLRASVMYLTPYGGSLIALLALMLCGHA